MGVNVELRSQVGPFNPGVRAVFADVRDSRYPDLRVTFNYTLIWLDMDQFRLEDRERFGELMVIKLYGVEVSRPGTLYPISAIGELTTSRIRDLPLHTWDTSARELLAGSFGTEAFKDAMVDTTKSHKIAGPDSYLSDPEMLDIYADNLLETIYPTVKQDDSPAGRRRLRALQRLAVVAVEYQRHRLEGRTDPAAEIARKHGVKPATARSWIHRARAAGLLSRRSTAKSNEEAPQ